MSESETVAATQRESSLLIRGAEPADHEAIRGVVLGAHAQHAGQLAPEVLLVAEAGDGVLGFAAFYPDASVQDSGFPSGWAAGAVGGYERLGYRRAPEFDATAPVRSVAHLRYMAQMYMNLARLIAP